MPPTINLDRLAEGFDCNYAPNRAQERQITVALTNSFGFGGTNSSLCFSKHGL
jgi:3-oxoacyl-[acyl-carrier-protein] synthase II